MNDIQKAIQKQTGIKQGAYANEKNRLYHQGKTLLKMAEIYVRQVEYANMTNEQFFIDFEDELNALSIKDHNASSK